MPKNIYLFILFLNPQPMMFTFKTLVPMTSESLIEDLRNDNTSGASEMMHKALGYLLDFSVEVQAENVDSYFRGVCDFGKRVIGSQPSMAPIFNAVNSILLDLKVKKDAGGNSEDLREALGDQITTIKNESRDAISKIQRNMDGYIQNGQTILTHSYSSTTIGSLVLSAKNGKEFEVYVTESRPGFEGRRTARILAEGGIPVVLIADMASFHFMDRVDMIITGCDCICEHGVVNKIGTKGLAMAAKNHDNPNYIVGERSKFLPSRYLKEPKIEERDPGEILGPEINISAKNIYFDITPWEYVTGIVTENGTMKIEEVKGFLGRMEVLEELLEV